MVPVASVTSMKQTYNQFVIRKQILSVYYNFICILVYMNNVWYLEANVRYAVRRQYRGKRIWLTANTPEVDQINLNEDKLRWISSYHLGQKEFDRSIRLTDVYVCKPIGSHYENTSS